MLSKVRKKQPWRLLCLIVFNFNLHLCIVSYMSNWVVKDIIHTMIYIFFSGLLSYLLQRKRKVNKDELPGRVKCFPFHVAAKEKRNAQYQR